MITGYQNLVDAIRAADNDTIAVCVHDVEIEQHRFVSRPWWAFWRHDLLQYRNTPRVDIYIVKTAASIEANGRGTPVVFAAAKRNVPPGVDFKIVHLTAAP